MKFIQAVIFLTLVGLLAGCGTVVPQVGEIWDGPNGTQEIEFEIRKRVFCDLGEAVRDAKKYGIQKKTPDGKVVATDLLPNTWGAQVTVGLNVEESTTLSPGVSLNTPMHAGITHFVGEAPPGSGALVSAITYPFLSTPQSYQLGLGGTLSSKATRNDKINAYWSVAYLNQEPTKESLCTPEGHDPMGENPSSSSLLLLVSDLGIKKWLVESISNNRLLPSVEAGAGAPDGKSPDVLQYEIKFDIVSSGNITPIWKLVRVTANTGSTPLFGTNRTRSHDLTITIGPGKESEGPTTASAKSQNKRAVTLEALTGPGERAANLHQATQIGLAVANSLRSLSQP